MTDLTDYECVLFDLDGVLTPTADVHMRAWYEMFTEYFDECGITPAYTDDDYFALVDGKPRLEGVSSVLASRGVHLKPGTADDHPGFETICGLGNRKNELFSIVLRRDGVYPYPGSVALLDHLQTAGVKVAVVSSSRNADTVLRAAGLRDRFGVLVDGLLADAQGLPGKPQPDTYAFAAQQLQASPARSVIIEDAVSGVKSGVAGKFGLVIGVDRGAGQTALTHAGANIVVKDLVELAMPDFPPYSQRASGNAAANG